MRIRVGIWVLAPAGAAAVWLIAMAAKHEPPAEHGTQSLPSTVVTREHTPHQYTGEFRDPFRCDAFMGARQPPKAPEKKKPRRAQPKPPPLSPPPCSVGGIVYTETNPMAILIAGGSSRLVKAGDIVDSMRIERVGRDTVWVRYRKGRFGLPKQ